MCRIMAVKAPPTSSHVVTRQPRRWDGFGVACHMEIAAPPAKVWEVLIDVDSTPLFIGTVEHVERIDGSQKDSPVKVGTRWKQTRNEGGAKSTTIITCTRIDDSDSKTYPKTISITTSIPGTVSTGSLSVECVEGNCQRCRLVVSFALVPQSLISRFLFTSPIGRYFIDKSAIKHVEDDMRDIAIASERRT